jgi:glycerol-3-phosphate acyltransferase PlsY
MTVPPAMPAPDALTIAVFALVGFLSGSLLFSLWLARLAGKDLRTVGDGNPGSTNALKAGGPALGALALALDMLKGALPVGAAYWLFGITGVPLILIGIMPVLGHAFSPWARGRGGKALAVTGGVWMALTVWELPTLGGITLAVWFSVVKKSGWAVLLLFATLGAYMALVGHRPEFLPLLAAHAAIVLFKYRADLREPPGLRDRVMRLGLVRALLRVTGGR